MFNNLTESAEAASSKTLDAFAEVICALAPEVCSVSFHDFAADTLLFSEDFLLPEDHKLVEDCLVRDPAGSYTIHYGTARRLAFLHRHSGARRTRRGQRRGAPDPRFGDRRSANPGAARAKAGAGDGVPLRRIRAPPRGTAPVGCR